LELAKRVFPRAKGRRIERGLCRDDDPLDPSSILPNAERSGSRLGKEMLRRRQQRVVNLGPTV